MAQSHSLFPLGVSKGARFKLPGKRYILGKDGVRAIEILAWLRKAEGRLGRPSEILARRPLVREIERIQASAALSYVIANSRDDRLRRLAIWLRGRSGGYLGAKDVAEFALYPNDAIRKEVARCLRRLKAWSPLREMATRDPDPKIRALATQATAENYERRQKRFLGNMSVLKTTSHDAPFLLSKGVDLSDFGPAKPPGFIRQVLARIQSLVTGA
jgi:hypothetical protein